MAGTHANIMELFQSLSPVMCLIMMVYFITGSPYPKLLLIKVLYVLKLIAELVLTTIDSKPLDKLEHNSIYVDSKVSNRLPSQVLRDKCDFTHPLTPEKECSKHPRCRCETEESRDKVITRLVAELSIIRHGNEYLINQVEKFQNKTIARLISELKVLQCTTETIKVQMEEIQKSITSLSNVSKETVAQMFELKQSTDLIKSLKHENEQLTSKSNQQREEIILLKEQIPRETLNPNEGHEHGPVSVPLPLETVVVSEVSCDKSMSPYEATNLLGKIACHIPRFELTSDHDIVGYLSDIDLFLKNVPNVTTAQKIHLIAMTSCSEVRRFIDRQPGDIVENYEIICQRLSEEFQIPQPDGIALLAARPLEQKKDELPSTFFRRLQKVWFQDKNDSNMEENDTFKSFFLSHLNPSIRLHLLLRVDKTMPSVHLRAVADDVHNKCLIYNLSHPQKGNSDPVKNVSDPAIMLSAPVQLSRRKRKAMLNLGRHPADRSANWRQKSGV